MADEQGFVTTFSAGFCSSSCFVLPPHKIDDVSKVENIDLYHIYIIARSPRARMVPNSFGREGDATFIEYRVGHEFQSEIRRIYFPSEYGVTAFDTPDGAGRNFEMAFVNGELSGDFPIFLMKSRAYLPILDHEVIYIGQAYGKSGGRNIADRLKSHETLQRIVAENAVAAPATDVIVYGFQYTGNDQVFMMFNGSDKNLIADDRDDERRERVLEEPIDDKQMTQIVEAALIRYFQPFYNKNFKKVFPSQSHNFLADIKELDYDGFVVELNTEDLDTKLFSDVVDPGLHHIVKFKMTARSTHPVFGFFGLMEDTGLDPQSGPIF